MVLRQREATPTGRAMTSRPCLGLPDGSPCPGRRLGQGTRCPDCQRVKDRLKDARRGGHGDWRARARAVAEHQDQHGPVCPGWAVPPHIVVPPNRLSADHPQSIAKGGPPHPIRYGVLCVSCNARKGDRA
jgi:hypothetical protein